MKRVLQVVGKMNIGGAEQLLMNVYRNIDRNKVQFDFLTFYDILIIEKKGRDMKLYTSYWYNVRFFPHNLICLSTVVWKPKYPVKDSTGQSPIIIDCEPFKPGKSCEGLCDGKCIPKHSYDCAFLKNYREQLKQISGEEFLNHVKDDMTITIKEGGVVVVE